MDTTTEVTQEMTAEERAVWQEQWTQLLAEIRSRFPADVSQEEFDADVAAAIAEVRAKRRVQDQRHLRGSELRLGESALEAGIRFPEHRVVPGAADPEGNPGAALVRRLLCDERSCQSEH